MNKISLDENELEAAFSNEAPPQEEGNRKEAQKKQETVSFVDPQKSSNIAIMLGYLKMTGEELRDAFITMDEKKLAQQHIEYFKDKTPTSDELNSIQSYNGDLALLSVVDKFYLAIQDIPRLPNRLACWAFKYKFRTEIDQIKPDVEAVSEAARQILESAKFKEMLAVILALTNFLNGNTNKKEAYGLKIASLTKLKDTKTADNKSNLLQYMASFCERKYPNLLTTYLDMPQLETSVRVSLSDLTAEYNKLKGGLEIAQKEVKMMQTSSLINDKFQESMESFLAIGTKKIEEIDKAITLMNERLTDLAISYSEDVQKMKQSPTSFFEHVANFLSQFRQAYEEFRKKRELEEKRARAPAKQQGKVERTPPNEPEKLGAKASRSRTKSIMNGEAFRKK